MSIPSLRVSYLGWIRYSKCRCSWWYFRSIKRRCSELTVLKSILKIKLLPAKLQTSILISIYDDILLQQESEKHPFIYIIIWCNHALQGCCPQVDVQLECRDVLGPAGVDAVQVSPVMEHIQGHQWWVRQGSWGTYICIYLLHKGVDSRLINTLDKSWELKGTMEKCESFIYTCVLFAFDWSWISPVKVSTHQRLLDLSQWHREAAPRSRSRMPESRCRFDVENFDVRWSKNVSKMIALSCWHWHNLQHFLTSSMLSVSYQSRFAWLDGMSDVRRNVWILSNLTDRISSNIRESQETRGFIQALCSRRDS